MDNWADYLYRQAQQMNVPILDSGKMNSEQLVSEILNVVRQHG